MQDSYTTRGEAFLGTVSLGSVDVLLRGVDDGTRRVGRGAIVFTINVGNSLTGRRLTIHPKDRTAAFDVVVVGIYNGGIAIASYGPTPWWT